MQASEEDSDHALALALAAAEEDNVAVDADGDKQDQDLALALSLMDEPQSCNVIPSLTRDAQTGPSSKLLPMPPNLPEAPEPTIFSRFVQSLYSLPVFSTSATNTSNNTEVTTLPRAEILDTLELPRLSALPDQYAGNQSFVLLLPDGSKPMQVFVPTAQQNAVPLYVTYSGRELVRKRNSAGSSGVVSAAALVALYRLNPVEITIPDFPAVLLLLTRGAVGGLNLVECEEGVFVHSAVSARREFAQTKLRAGDLLLQVGGESVTNLEEVIAAAQNAAAATTAELVELRVLRRPAFVARCPNAGHALREGVRPENECFKCANAWAFATCPECDFSLCKTCLGDVEYAARHAPQDIMERETGLGFSQLDVGTRVLVFWQTLLQWVPGTIEAYDVNKGHTVLYEELKCREVILNFNLREHRVLVSSSSSGGGVEDGPVESSAAAEEEEEEHVLLMEDAGEKIVLTDQQQRALLELTEPAEEQEEPVEEEKQEPVEEQEESTEEQESAEEEEPLQEQEPVEEQEQEPTQEQESMEEEEPAQEQEPVEEEEYVEEEEPIEEQALGQSMEQPVVDEEEEDEEENAMETPELLEEINAQINEQEETYNAQDEEQEDVDISEEEENAQTKQQV